MHSNSIYFTSNNVSTALQLDNPVPNVDGVTNPKPAFLTNFYLANTLSLGKYCTT